ncbi:hypothetical protein [Beduini massiliensis]|uniref:hypothetical protein n=1 Tax=Beduini massiliensis TaxID=1585974 RepID=UPI003562ED94
MSIFSISLCVLLIYQFIKLDFKKNYELLIIESILLKLLCDIGIGIDLPFISLRPYEIVFYILTIFSFFILVKKRRPSKKQIKLFIILLILIFVNNALLIIHPLNYKTVCFPNLWYDYFTNGISGVPMFSKFVIIYDIYFIMFYINVCSIFNFYKKQDIIKLFKKTLNIAFKVLIIIVITEIIIKLIFGDSTFYILRDSIFGIGDDTSSLLKRGSLITIYGLCTEPSSLALSLFYIGLGIISVEKCKKIILLKLLVLCFIGILTGSMLFYLLFLLLVTSFLLNKSNNIILIIRSHKILFFCILLAIINFFIIFSFTQLGSYYLNRVYNIIDIIFSGKHNLNSESVRIYSAIEMIQVFIRSPLIGSGLGTAYGYSSLLTFLANFGLCGVLFYFYIWKYFIGKIAIKKIIYIVFPLLISLLIHGSINTFVFPQFIYLLFLVYYANYKKGEQND